MDTYAILKFFCKLVSFNEFDNLTSNTWMNMEQEWNILAIILIIILDFDYYKFSF